MSKMIKNITKWPVVLGLQVIASLLLLVFVFGLGALPPMYFAILVIVLAALLLISFLLMKPSKKEGKGKVREALGKIVSLLLSVVLIIGTLYVGQGSDVLDSITGKKEKINRYNVYTLIDNKAETADDLSFYHIGMSKAYDTEEHYLEAHNALLNDNDKIRIEEYEDYALLLTDLLSGKLEAICVNEAFNGVFEETNKDFMSSVKVVWSHDIIEQIEEFSKKVDVTNSVFTIFISGIDATGKVSTVSRSDVNMLVTVNPVTKDILMTSMPRDYYVTLANKGKKDKLTHAGLAGIENSVKTLENVFDIDINYYAKVNFTSLVKIVDALGGITIDIPKDFRANADKSYFKKGVQVLNGKQSLAFVRERYAWGGGDGDRIANQQKVLRAMLDKAMSPAIITNYMSLLDAIDGSFETNMSSEEIMNLIQMQLHDMTSWNFHSTICTGYGKQMTGGAYMPSYKLYYCIPNQETIDKASALIKQMTNGEKITTE